MERTKNFQISYIALTQDLGLKILEKHERREILDSHHKFIFEISSIQVKESRNNIAVFGTNSD